MAQQFDVVRVEIGATILTFNDVVSDDAICRSAALAEGASLSLDPGYQ
jgi:hypothetical protein